MTTRKEKKEKILSRIFGIEDEQLNPSKAKKHVSEPTKSPIRVLEKRHVSAPAKISVRPRSKFNITKLPNDLKSLFVKKYLNMLPDEYRLRDWIPDEKIDWRGLCQNPNAINMIEERLALDSTLSKEEYNIRYYRLTNGLEYKTVNWSSLSINKNAIKLIKERIIAEDLLTLQEYETLGFANRLDWTSIAVNEDYEAMKLLGMKPSKINWNLLSINKNAMELFILPKYNEEKLIEPEILFNIMHYANKKLDWSQLSRNEGAIKIIKEHLRFEDTIPLEIYNDLDSSNIIDWGGLAANPKALSIITKFIEKYIQYEDIDDEEHPYYRYAKHFDDIWRNLSKNPTDAAIKYLNEKYPEKINWRAFSGNPKAIKYLNDPINYERIDWSKLSKNTAAIDLLKENIEKIDWYYISCNTNPKAMELIRVKFEQELLDAENNTLHLLSSHEKLNWSELSKNPAIFEEIFYKK
jgi:hypothetical protein